MTTFPTLEDPAHAEFLASVLDHLDEGVYFVDPQRTLTLWNRAAETITGLPSRSSDGLTVRTNQIPGGRRPPLPSGARGPRLPALGYLSGSGMEVHG